MGQAEVSLAGVFDAWRERWNSAPPVHELPPEDLLAFSTGLDEAASALENAGKAWSESGQAAGLARSAITTALRARDLGDFPASLRILTVVTAGLRGAGLPSLLARSLNLTGNVLTALGRYPESIDCYRDAIETYRQCGEEGAARTPLVYSNAGTNLVQLMQFDQAEAYLRRAFTLAKALPRDLVEKHNPGTSRELLMAIILNNMGYLCSHQARHTKPDGHAWNLHQRADQYMRQAVAMRPGSFHEMRFQGNVAENLIYMGELKEAERILSDLEGLCRTVDEFRPLLPSVFFDRAELALAQDHVSQARDYAHQAMLLALQRGDMLHEREITDTFLAIVRRSVALQTREGQAGSAALGEGPAAQLVEDLILFLEQKDTYTGLNHSKGVANVTLRLAEALLAEGVAVEHGPHEPDSGWGNCVNRQVLRLAGLLHDIGKLRIPWSLLNKPARLTPGERTVLQSHAAEGEQILLRLGLGDIGRLVVEHHETPTGTGYPYGTKDSSLMGACIAVADVFEAATTIKRAWRPPKKKDEIVREVVDLAGVQFDARVAKALSKVFPG